MRLDQYFKELQEYHGKYARDLIRAWENSEMAAVEDALRAAVATANYIGWEMPNFEGTNQALGNKAAKLFDQRVGPCLGGSSFWLQDAPGAGYPDSIFRCDREGYCLELKATSEWKPGDANRRVLTSMPDKLCKLIDAGMVGNPPAHMIGTVLYNADEGRVIGFRVDFIGPDTHVNVRFEASTSQKFLSEGTHRSIVID